MFLEKKWKLSNTPSEMFQNIRQKHYKSMQPYSNGMFDTVSEKIKGIVSK
jgi:hypothetical protein